MGGADWERWITFLADRSLLADGFTTAALSYIGSPLTAAIYREGTIGAAKSHLEATARRLDERLGKTLGGRAVTSVNAAAVTQSSTAIPGIALYVGLLRGVLGDAMVAPIGQLVQLWDQLTGVRPLAIDDEGRIRLDTWELDPAVQSAVAERWNTATGDTIGELADLDWFGDEVRRLHGFSVPGIDYTAAVDPDTLARVHPLTRATNPHDAHDHPHDHPAPPALEGRAPRPTACGSAGGWRPWRPPRYGSRRRAWRRRAPSAT